MAVRVTFVPGREPPELLDLAWEAPLATWQDHRLVDMARGVSRHVVRFVRDGDRVYALKETTPEDAAREYAMLRALAAERLPVVEAVGLVTGRRTPAGSVLDAVLITRYLDYSLPFRYLLGSEGGLLLGSRLVDAAVVLLTRLHLDGFYWGDCSLSNLLFRRDAGALTAYLVDAETAEHHQPLPEGMRYRDIELARENVAGGLLDLIAEGRADVEPDVVAMADMLEDRYNLLWDELTGTHEVDAGERHLIDRRIRRLNELGFDVGELVVERDHPGGGPVRLRVTPVLVEEGHHSGELRRLTGLVVQENQARRLLNDISAFGAYLSRTEDRPLPQGLVAARWLAEVYEPIVAAVPEDLLGRLEPAELFHELLEHRYFLSLAAGEGVDTVAALASYLETVLKFRPDERVVLDE